MVINLRFLGQGLQTDGNSTGNVLIESLQDREFSSFTSFVAWAGLAGIDQLREHIQSSNISNWNIFLGIDLKGTSKEALEALLEIGVNTKIFYTTTPITYHPKIYLFEGEQKSRVIIGSSNVTERGLFNNIEGGVIIEITHPDEQGNRFIQEIKDYFSSFLSGENPNLHELTTALIESLREQGLIPNEQERRQSHERAGEESSSTTAREATRTLFPPMPMQRSPQRRRQQTRITPPTQTTEQEETPATTESPVMPTRGNLVWRKENLPRSDVLIAPSGSNPTGGLRLTQANWRVHGRPIDWTTYFRNDLFGNFTWSIARQEPLVEVTDVLFNITIRGIDRGQHRLQLRHKPSGEAGQRNYTTSLSWGEVSDLIRSLNLVGNTLSLYAPQEGVNEPFFIEIEGEPQNNINPSGVQNLLEF